jgi:RimJ/RimL family protein N-acetyltransferase
VKWPPKIFTERLIIRPFQERDIEPSYKLNLDEEVSRYTGDGGIVSFAEIERRIKENVWGDYERYGYGRMAVESKETGEFIGFTGLKYLEDLKRVDIGFRFARKWWGKGYATESALPFLEYGFESLNLPEIIAMVLPENKASIRVIEKLGMSFEKETIEDGLNAYIYQLKKENYAR